MDGLHADGDPADRAVIRVARRSVPSASVSGARTQNSSPPKRATVSWPRVARCQRGRDIAQQAVARGMAEAVIEPLKPSRSSITSAKLRRARRWRSIS